MNATISNEFLLNRRYLLQTILSFFAVPAVAMLVLALDSDSPLDFLASIISSCGAVKCIPATGSRLATRLTLRQRLVMARPWVVQQGQYL
jgi:hypothetical protein